MNEWWSQRAKEAWAQLDRSGILGRERTRQFVSRGHGGLRTRSLLFHNPVPLFRDEPTNNAIWDTPHAIVKMDRRQFGLGLPYEVAIASTLPTGVPYPPLLDAGHLDNRFYIVQRRVAGERGVEVLRDSGDGDVLALVHGAAGIMDCLHKTPQAKLWPKTPLSPIPWWGGDWKAGDNRNEFARQMLFLERSGSLAAEELDAIRDAYYFLENMVGPHAPALRDAAVRRAFVEPVALHGDLHFNQFLFRRRTRRVTAVLDFETGRSGPPIEDWYMLMRNLGHRRPLMRSDAASHGFFDMMFAGQPELACLRMEKLDLVRNVRMMQWIASTQRATPAFVRNHPKFEGALTQALNIAEGRSLFRPFAHSHLRFRGEPVPESLAVSPAEKGFDIHEEGTAFDFEFSAARLPLAPIELP